jgi:hypothetical protein
MLLYCVLAVSPFGVPSRELQSSERQTRKAVKTLTEQSPLESKQVWLTEILQRFSTLDSTRLYRILAYLKDVYINSTQKYGPYFAAS